jgi:starch synthase
MTLRVLSVASEAWPFIKTGGLADVVGALPAALADHDVAVTTLIPAYRELAGMSGEGRVLRQFPDVPGAEARLIECGATQGSLVLFDAPALFARAGGPYGDARGADWPDNWRRFAAFGLAAAQLASGGGGLPAFDVLHAHDWQASMAPVYLRYRPDAAVMPPAVLTIHNIAFQGRFEAQVFPRLGLPAGAFALDGVEYYGGVGFLKGGLQAAAAITTVSPTYAMEIREPAFGMGLEGLIAERFDAVTGILNGIDTKLWDPSADPDLAARYDLRSLARRQTNRSALEAAFGLDAAGGPIFCVISRLTWQKGVDLLVGVADRIVASGGRLAVLGTGEASLETAFAAAAARHPGRIGARIGFDEKMSHLMQGGADAILIPSRFEPCGLTQMYGLRYGCVPIVARTGGLADTVIDANEAALGAGVATGFVCEPDSAASLAWAIARATALFADPPAWRTLQRQGMKADFSWKRGGARYADLYRRLAEARS